MATAQCLSDYLEQAILYHVFNKVTLAQPYIYVGLCTDEPGETGTGASCWEVFNENGYVRAAAYFWERVYEAVYNDAVVTFPLVEEGGWGEVSHFAFFDSQTYGLGNMLLYGALSEPRDIVEGSVPRFDISAFVIDMG